MALPLASYPVLLLDCQTTGAAPNKGHLLEVAWAVYRARDLPLPDASSVTSHLVRLPENSRIPRRVSTLTGIVDQDLAAAPTPVELWQRLSGHLTRLGRGRRIPAVAHFARFERSFLQDLADREGAGHLPLRFVCTHEISRRLLADLPRCSLRAVAGYYGYVMESGKRAATHVHATLVIWHHLVAELGRRQQITTWEQLFDWLDQPKTRVIGGRDYPLDRERRLALPDQPGVYRMQARGGTVLYVGKATSLKKRVNSYFQKRRLDRPEKILELVSQVRDVDVTITASAVEAALLESDEIKRLTPPYNRALRRRASGLWFASPTFDQIQSTPKPGCAVGPFPGYNELEAFGELRGLIEQPDQPLDIGSCRRAVGLSHAGVGLETGHFAEALGLFVARLEPLEAPTVERLFHCGIAGWRAWLERDTAQEESEPEEDTSEEEERLPFQQRFSDPQNIVSALEWICLRVTHMKRRADWLTWLSESSILFEPVGRPESRRLLIIQAGEIASTRDVSPGQPLPAPPGHLLSADQRRLGFDQPMYDRLRVLTTELRRILKDRRTLQVRFGPRRRFSGSGLERRLSWL